jgi:hypothetical protein
MAFSISTCLTNKGTSDGPYDIYSNIDGYDTPFLTNVLSTNLFGDNCPYIIDNVPDNTTSIKIIETTTNCCVIVEIQSNELCIVCDIDFDIYVRENVGKIVAGNITGSCENQITDYKISWYGPDSVEDIAFTSGFGNEFGPYDLTHPLTGTSSPTALAGIYKPVIDIIKINGLDFTNDGGDGTIQSELDCFETTTVEVFPFTCDNGTEAGNYAHRVNFSNASVGVTPLTLRSTFRLNSTINYFAWTFQGFTVPDTLKITFYGSAYNEPIILEYYTVGSNLSSSNYNVFPRLIRSNSILQKVTNLSNFIIGDNDYLLLEVIPNPNNPQTNWDFYFTCLTDFDCDLCQNQYINEPYKIISQSITTTPRDCDEVRIRFDLSGCTFNDYGLTDIYKYAGSLGTRAFVIGSSLIFNSDLYYESTGCSSGGSGNPGICLTPNNNIITFEKTVTNNNGVINMTFTDLNDLNIYLTSYNNKKTSLINQVTNPWIDDPTIINYYKYLRLEIPYTVGNNLCGDGINRLYFNVHLSSVPISGITNGLYTLTIPMPTIQSGLLTFDQCEIGCASGLSNIISSVNSSSTGTTNNISFTNNSGSLFDIPFSVIFSISPITTTRLSGTIGNAYSSDDRLNRTLPVSGATYTLIPSLTGFTCDISDKGQVSSNGRIVYFSSYRVNLTDPNNLRSFEIRANEIINGALQTTNYPILVLTYVDGVITFSNPNYVI